MAVPFMSNSTDRKNVVWISMESVRADHTTPAGYERETTPNLSRIADHPDGQWFERAFSTARWTPASTSSILTGTYLSTHTVGIHSPTVNKLPESLDTIPELLAREGYDTFGFGNNAYITAGTELDRGFDRFVDPGPKNLHRTVGLGAVFDYLWNIGRYGPGLTTDRSKHKLSSMLTHATKRWLRSRDSSDDPFFAYMHLNDSHYPYTPPDPFVAPFADEGGLTPDETLGHTAEIYEDVFQVVADGLDLTDEQWDAIEAAYDGDIAYVDHFIGELFDCVRSDLDRDTIFVVTSDHAELFGECGWLGHHVAPATDVFHVPLVVYGMPEIDHQSENFVQHVDLTRTIVESLGGSSEQFEGINLTEEAREFAVGQSSPAEKDRRKLQERNETFDVDKYRWDSINCIWDDEFKLIVGEDDTELFELPDEMTNVVDDHPDVAADMKSTVAETLPGLPTTGRRDPAEFDEGVYGQLRTMGYIQ